MKIFALLAVLTLATLYPLAAEPRTFTDTQGRTIKAEVLGTDGSTVRLRLESGQVMNNVDINLFSAPDRAFISEWGINEAIRNDRALELSIAQRAVDRRSMDNAGYGGTGKRSVVYYELPLRNRTNTTFDDITVKYVIFWTHERLGTDPRAPNILMRTPGSVKIDRLGDNETNNIQTETVTLIEDSLPSNTYFTNGGRRNAKDRLEGIWIKIYRKGDLLIETSRPEFIRTRYTWDE